MSQSQLITSPKSKNKVGRSVIYINIANVGLFEMNLPNLTNLILNHQTEKLNYESLLLITSGM